MIYTQINREKNDECKAQFEYFSSVTFHLNLFPIVALLLIRYLINEDCINHPRIIGLVTAGSSFYQILCFQLRIHANIVLDNQDSCSNPFLNSFCLYTTMTCSIIFGAVWLAVVALFLQYSIRSAAAKLKMMIAISFWIVMGSGFVILKIYQAEIPEICPNNLLLWSIRAMISNGTFLIVYCISTSHSLRDNNGNQLRVFGSFFMKLFIPFNLFWYFQGIDWFEEAKDVNARCIVEPKLEYLELAMYEWLIFSVFLTMAVCHFLLRYQFVTFNQLWWNPYLMLIGFPTEQIEQDWEDPVQAENRLALLHSGEFDASRHSNSFEEKAVCPICWENFITNKRVIYFPGCDHLFHSHCIKEWVQAHNSCPTCRRTLPPAVEMHEFSHP